MNPLFKNPMPINPMQRIGQVVNDVRMLQQNPAQLGKYLSDHGMISNEQLAQMGQMSPSQAGQYLVQQGIMPQNAVQNMQQFIPTIQSKL
jgi:hypothetical protein